MSVSRLRLYDMLISRFPQAIGLCASDVARVADAVNSAQERLLTCPETRDTGPFGTYAEMAFNVSQADPRLVLPRGVARAIRLDACDEPVRIQNQFSEYLQFGSGHWPKLRCSSTPNVCGCGPMDAFRRNTVPTFLDIAATGKTLQVWSQPEDDGKRVLVACHDANGLKVTSMNGNSLVQGVMVTLSAPTATLTLPGGTLPLGISSVDGIQKDITLSPVYFYESDLTTGATRLLSSMEPGEQVAAYTVYYLNKLPNGCCPAPGVVGAVQMLAMVKLDLVPCRVDTDYLLIQSREALICEGQSMRLGDTDSQGAKQQAILYHRQAIGYLNGLSAHYEGTEQPAVLFSPFGSAHLSRQMIGYQT